jgi:hypothetical protein
LGRTNIRQPVALQVDANRHAHLVWVDEGRPSRLRYAHLDEQAQVLSNEPSGIDLPSPRKPQLLVDRENQVHLAFLSRSGGMQRLYHALLSPDGQWSTPLLISSLARNVDSFHMYLAPEGRVAFVWADELDDGTAGIVHAALPLGDTPVQPVTLVQPGIDPYILVDGSGNVHLVWMVKKALTSRDIYYAELRGTFPQLELVPAGGLKLTDFVFPEGGTYYGPVLGVDTQNVYVLWSVQHLGGGLTPTSAFSFYATFELGAHEQGGKSIAGSHTIGLPTEDRPVYEGYASPYGLTKLARLPEKVVGPSDFANSPATVSSQRDDLPVQLSLLTQSRSESQIQLATAVLVDGELIGYQLASQTGTASLTPSIVAGPDGLHSAWIDTAGFKVFTVYYASTAPEARRWLDRTSTSDMVMGAANLVFGVFSGLGLLPIAGIWTFPALVWVVLFFIVTGQEEMERTPAKIGFALAVVIYVGMKILLLPGLFAGTPFLYRVPPGWATLLGLAVPALILLVALAAVYIYGRRAERATIFKAYLVFALTDVALTLILYSPGFFGSA